MDERRFVGKRASAGYELRAVSIAPPALLRLKEAIVRVDVSRSAT